MRVECLCLTVFLDEAVERCKLQTMVELSTRRLWSNAYFSRNMFSTKVEARKADYSVRQPTVQEQMSLPDIPSEMRLLSDARFKQWLTYQRDYSVK